MSQTIHENKTGHIKESDIVMRIVNYSLYLNRILIHSILQCLNYDVHDAKIKKIMLQK